MGLGTVFDKIGLLFGKKPEMQSPNEVHGRTFDASPESEYNQWRNQIKDFRESIPPAVQAEVTRAHLEEAAKTPTNETNKSAHDSRIEMLANLGKRLLKKKDLTSNNETAQSDRKDPNMGLISDVIEGRGDGDKPMTRNEVGEALSALDAKLDPLLALAGEQAEHQASRQAELEALKALNEARKKQGKEPYPEDEEDKDMPKDEKKAPGKHDKKDARIANLERTVAGMQKLLEGGNHSQDALAIGSLNDDVGERKTLLSSGREIGVERSWDWIYNKAPQIRRGLALSGKQSEIAELDAEVCKIRMELQDAGVQAPTDITQLGA